MKRTKPEASRRVGYALDPRFLDHRTPPSHPERPERLQAIMEMLKRFDNEAALSPIAAQPAPLDLLTRVHTDELVATLRESARRPHTRFDTDTYAVSASFEVARLAAGYGLELTRQVLTGSLDTGFALVRPPGHHAESGRAMGFCLINNVALAAESARMEKAVERVAIVDFDVHHGNGTQEIFYSRNDVLYISTHQHPLYPGTGALHESGRAEGEGFTVNLPLPAGLGDPTYNSLFADLICPILSAFQPDVILVSAGFDAHARDPLASMNVSEKGFGQMARHLNEVAGRVCSGKIVYFLEGGYDLEALAESVRAVIQEALSPGTDPAPRDESDFWANFRAHARSHLHPWWPAL